MKLRMGALAVLLVGLFVAISPANAEVYNSQSFILKDPLIGGGLVSDSTISSDTTAAEQGSLASAVTRSFGLWFAVVLAVALMFGVPAYFLRMKKQSQERKRE